MRKIVMRYAVLLLVVFSFAAPIENAAYNFEQPDGSLVSVLVTGDEFYQEVTSPDGTPLIRDDDGWICYAIVADDGSDYISTGVRYGVRDSGGKLTVPPPLPPNVPREISSVARGKKREAAFKAMYPNGRDLPDMNERFPAPRSAVDAPLANPETIYGITILIDFPDQSSALSKSQIDDLYNKVGYTGGNNNGSVRDYYYEVSNGRITYLNELSNFVRHTATKASLDNAQVSYNDQQGAAKIQGMMSSALQAAIRQGSIDVSKLSVDSRGYVRGVNFMYAGSPNAGWGKGLWPHQWQFQSGPIDIGGGKKVLRYQLTNIGNAPAIGTIVHENGHLLYGWPDLYHYNSRTHGAGNYCVMSTSSSTNPMYPNPYFRHLQGWIDTLNFAGHQKGTTYTLHDTSKTIYTYSVGNANEAFYFEVKHRSGRNTNVPDGGLAIWHVDRNGDNTTSNPTSAYGPHDLGNIEQADGRNDLEKKVNMGDQTDLFRSNINKTTFNDQTSPNGKWHTGSASGIDIRNISAYDKRMTFSYGAATQQTLYQLSVVGGTGSGEFAAGTKVDIIASAPKTGEEFAGWTGSAADLALLADRTASATSLTMPSRAVTLTATYRATTYPLTVVSGTGSGNYPAGQNVSISANRAASGEEFSSWDGSAADVSLLQDKLSAATTLKMPNRDVALTAVYRSVPYKLTVEGGKGGGEYFYGEMIDIAADNPEPWNRFERWDGSVEDLGLLSDPKSRLNGLRMPARNVAFTAVFSDLPPDGILMPLGEGDVERIAADTLFYDDGWLRPYSADVSGTLTVKPMELGSVIGFELLELSLATSGADSLSVWSGAGFEGPLLATFKGEGVGGETLWSLSDDGALTFFFYSDNGEVSGGWKANLLVQTAVAVEHHSKKLRPNLRWSASLLWVTLPQSERMVQTTLYSLDGQRLWSSVLTSVEAGEQQIALPIERMSASVYWVKVKTDRSEAMLRFVP